MSLSREGSDTGPSGTGRPVSAPGSASHIPSLDGIRAVSFLVVFLGHAAPRHMPVTAEFGVTVFFFLSGFLITTLMRTEFEKHGSINVRHFYLRRALRILPPFYLVWLAATLAALLLYPPGTLYGPTMAAQLLFVANYEGLYALNREAPGTGVLWSLAVEEHFYLLFPWLYIALQKWHIPRRRQAWLLWGLCALILAWRFIMTLVIHADSKRIYIATDTRVDSILFGCALAVYGNPALDEPSGTPNLWKYWLLPAALVALGLTCAYHGDVYRQTWYFTAQGVVLTLLFTAAIRFYTWPLFRILNARPVIFIGALSYSLYLVHQVVLRAVGRLWPQGNAVSRAGVTLAASMILAWAIYRLIETPCARLRKQLTDQ
jgi:peptidoglycan/LPS O-acetylase OafA/YrhL